MTYKGIFIDDQEPVYAETLSTTGKLKFELEPVQEVITVARKVLASKPNIVAIDYRLDEAPAGLQADRTYKGSGLAQHLRDESIENPEHDFALILVSAENKIKTLYRPDKTAHDLFDRVYIKEEVNKNRSAVRRELISLCAGYEVLRSSGGKYDILTLMSAEEDERPYIDTQEIRVKLEEATAPHIVSRILFNLVDRPGILLDRHDVGAYLGINPTTAHGVFTRLDKDGIAYRGLFGDAWPRWWANRLELWAQSIFKRRATGLPAADRAAILTKEIGDEIKPALSPWNNSPKELTSFACATCRRGAELRHSVAAFEPLQPRWATRRRICWDCVQTDQYDAIDPPLAIDDADLELVERVKKLDRNGDGAETAEK